VIVIELVCVIVGAVVVETLVETGVVKMVVFFHKRQFEILVRVGV
jgi:hypothetical protein